MNITAIEGLTSEEFKISGATFRINKVRGLDGFLILEKIRIALAGSTLDALSESASGGDEVEAGKRMMSAIMSVDADKVFDLLKDFVQHIDVKIPASDRFVQYSKIESAVNDLIDPIDFYEILVRAIAVNFTESIRGLMSRLGLNQAS